MKIWPWLALAAILAAIIIIRVTSLHWAPLDIPYKPVEWFYVQPGNDMLAHGINADLAYYMSRSGNPMLTSLILMLGYWIFGQSPFVSRLIILLLALAFYVWLFIYLKKRENTLVALITATLVASNPLAITYAVHVATDVPYMIFISAAMLVYIYGNNIKSGLASSVLFGLALATKYIAVLVYPVVIIASALKNGFSKAGLIKTVKFNLWYIPLSVVIALPVLILPLIILSHNGQSFGETLASWTHGILLTPTMETLPTRFFSYIAWLGLFVGISFLLIAYDLFQKMGKWRFLCLLLGLIVFTLILSQFIPMASLHLVKKHVSELNLCALEPRIPATVLSSAMFIGLIAAELFIVSLVCRAVHGKDKKITFLTLWILVTIVLMIVPGFATQRYMLAVLVPTALYIAMVSRGIQNKWIVGVVLALHVCFYLFVGYYVDY